MHGAPKLVFEVSLRHTTRGAVEYAADSAVIVTANTALSSASQRHTGCRQCPALLDALWWVKKLREQLKESS